MEMHVVVQRHRVQVGIDAVSGQKRRQGRGKAQRTWLLGVVQRLDPEAVILQNARGRALDSSEVEAR